MMIETDADLVALKLIGGIVADCLRYMGKALEPGITTKELDDLGRQFLDKHGARSAPEAVYSFPGATCISVNHEVAHGIPGDKKIERGDVVNIDVSAVKDGYFGDTGGSFIVPPSNKLKDRLLTATKAARDAAVAEAKAGRPLNVIGGTIEREAHARGFSVIQNLGSHGVGRKLHEAPEFIPPFHDATDRRTLKEGMVITIEPFFSTGATEAKEAKDGWTLYTGKKFLSAQFEHSLVITKGAPIILTL